MKLNDVKKLYDLGFSLIYLHERDKRPLEAQWTSGKRKTWAELENSFESRYNLGVRLGESSRINGHYLACIDVDIKDPRFKKTALAKLKELTGDEEFPTVLSGSGGGNRHLYFVSAKPFPMITVAKHPNEWEICIYSTGRQMVCPPSVHPTTGMKYMWNQMGATLFDIPFPLMDFSDLESVSGSKKLDTIKMDFKAVDVDLYETGLPFHVIEMIETGGGDKSASLMSVVLHMCRRKMTDNQILSVLTDEQYGLATVGYEHTQSNSRLRAAQWINKYTLTKARHETSIMRRFENPPKFVELSGKKLEEFEERIDEINDEHLPDLTGHGKPKVSLRNIIHVLEKKMGGGLVGYDEFANQIVFLKDTVYGGVKGRVLDDDAELNLKYYLANHYGFEPGKEMCWEAHTIVCKRHTFHPVREYLDSLVWDGKPRLDTWLARCMAAVAPAEYLKAVSRKTLVGAVTRIYEPGSKFEYMTVLEGFQGEGKSTALRILAGDKWFTDNIGDIHSKDVVDQMVGKWIIEFSELVGITNKETNFIKNFLSTQEDRVRLPYARRSKDFPRQSIFLGSTNNDEYLVDETGNRRYWPIKINAVNLEWLHKNRDQLWAEAKVRYDLGETVYLAKGSIEDSQARIEQDKRLVGDEWTLKVMTFVSGQEGNKLTATQIFQGFDGNASVDPTHQEAMRIGRIMRKLGYARKTIRVGDHTTKGWII